MTDDHAPAAEAPDELDPDALVLSIAAQLVGSMRTLDDGVRAETCRAYMAGETVIGLSRDGLVMIPVDQLPPSPQHVPGYL